jgi:endonuclease YncB( thermonuclease family)
MRLSRKSIISLVTLGLSVIFLFDCSITSCTSNLARSPNNSLSLTSTVIPSISSPEIQKPTLTSSHTPTPTKTSTTTPTPTNAPVPTDDLSFYSAANCLPRDTGYQKGTVIDVVDGDTIVVQLTDNITTTVRYIGMDAPESGFPFAESAIQANSNLVLYKEVVLIRDHSENDLYYRLLRYVVVGNTLVNQELVRRGLARVVSYPPDEACNDALTATEREAQAAMAGIWAATPTPEADAGQVIILEVNKGEEWVDLQNVGSTEVNLAGWTLVSERGDQECALTGIINAGEILRIWAMTAQGQGYSCGYGSPIWNNSQPDPAVLYNAQGAEVSRK